MSNLQCEVVKNQASGKEFWYCRTHRDECAPGGCLEVVTTGRIKKRKGADFPMQAEMDVYSRLYNVTPRSFKWVLRADGRHELVVVE